MRPISIRLPFFILMILAVANTAVCAAQSYPVGISTDGSIGPALKLELQEQNYDIRSEYGRIIESNLFHSFEQFNLHTNETATFTGPSSIQNIISRVTGGNSSYIDGTIRSAIDGADLYFLNPSGVIFGSNARLDVSGSFHVSTADYLRMGQEARFYSYPVDGENLLTLNAPPSAFGFLDHSEIGSITFEGNQINSEDWDGKDTGLSVPEGKTLSLIGGDIEMDGTYYEQPFFGFSGLGNLNAPAGRINLASVASGGEVVLNENNVDVSSFSKLGNMSLYMFSKIATSGEKSGDIYIRAGEFLIEDSSIVADTLGDKDGGIIDIRVDSLTTRNGDIFSDTSGSGKGGSIRIEASDSVDIEEYSMILSDSNPDNSFVDNAGDAGDVSIQAKSLTISSSMMSSDTYATGNGGNVILKADDSITISDSWIFTVAEGKSETAGDGGAIVIEANRILLENGGNVSSDTYYGGGQGGSITISGHDYGFAESIEIKNSKIFSGAIDAKYEGSGDGGIVDLKAKTVSFTDGGRIKSESEGSGNGGHVVIQAEDSIRFSGADEEGYASKIYTTSLNAEDYAGDGGHIGLIAPRITFEDGGGVSASTYGPGTGGTIVVSASDTLTITGVNLHGENADGFGSGIYARSENDISGQAGDIYVEANALTLQNGGVITSSTRGPGKGGTITINQDPAFLPNSITITGDGSDVTLLEPLTSQITYQNTASQTNQESFSGIYSRSESEQLNGGDAGSISLKTNSLYLSDAGKISTSTSGGGNAGEIELNISDVRLETDASVASASNNTHAGGDAGTVAIHADQQISLSSNSAVTTSTEGLGNAGSIELSALAVKFDTGGIVSSASNNPGEGGDAGSITIKAAESLKLDGGTTSINTSSFGRGNAGDIEITDAPEIELESGANISSSSNSKETGGEGGTIHIQGSDLSRLALRNQSTITTSTEGSGNAGNIQCQIAGLDIDSASINSTSNHTGAGGDAGSIDIQITDQVTLDHQSTINTSTFGQGKAGAIDLKGKTIFLDNQSSVSSTSNSENLGGEAGIITATAVASLILTGNSALTTSTDGLGNAGSIELSALAIKLDTGGIVSSASNNPGEGGDAGSITIKAAESLKLDGGTTSINTSSFGRGNAGDIEITDVPEIELESGANISSSSNSKETGGEGGTIHIQGSDLSRLALRNQSTITTSTEGSGNAGNIQCQIAGLDMDSASINSTSNHTGAGGDAGSIDIQITDQVTLDHQSTINTSTFGQGKAGAIDLKGKTIFLDNQSSVSSTSNSENLGGEAGIITASAVASLILTGNSALTTEAKGAGGGKIFADAGNAIYLINGEITSSVRLGYGDGGDVTLDSTFVVLNHSEITANAEEGDGGAIFIFTDNYFKSADSQVTATSKRGNDGTVQIVAPDIDIAGSLIVLPASYLDATRWIVKSCAERVGEDVSKFVVVGRDGVLRPLDDWLANP